MLVFLHFRSDEKLVLSTRKWVGGIRKPKFLRIFFLSFSLYHPIYFKLIINRLTGPEKNEKTNPKKKIISSLYHRRQIQMIINDHSDIFIRGMKNVPSEMRKIFEPMLSKKKLNSNFNFISLLFSFSNKIIKGKIVSEMDF